MLSKNTRTIEISKNGCNFSIFTKNIAVASQSSKWENGQITSFVKAYSLDNLSGNNDRFEI